MGPDMGWVQIVDQSRDPITDYAAAYADGVRVLAGYAGLGSAPKWMTPAQISRWKAAGPDTGILALAEGTGREPVESPSSGASHGHTARAAWHALGMPDDAAICYAVDLDITASQARGQVETYFRGVAGADGTRPLAYVERDAGELLHAAGVIAGYGTPAAYGWDPSGRLVTPATAPAACVWTQEHNGVQRWGGTVDLGHIRTTAPIWWLHEGDDMDQDQFNSLMIGAAANASVRAAWLGALVHTDGVVKTVNYAADRIKNPTITLETLIREACNQGHASVMAAQAASDPGKLAAALAPLLPAGTSVDTQTLVTALRTALTGMTLTTTVEPGA